MHSSGNEFKQNEISCCCQLFELQMKLPAGLIAKKYVDMLIGMSRQRRLYI